MWRTVNHLMSVVSENPDASGKIVEKIIKEVPVVVQAASEAVKAAVKIMTK